MKKTSVYLPDELKRSLRRMAETSGRSEADIIREGVAAQVHAAERPRPRGGLFSSGDGGFAEHVDEALAGFGER